MSVLTAAEFLNADGRRRVEEAIGQAERLTSGELRVHLEDQCPEDVLDHAAFLFAELGMQRTRERNGVLIYVSVADHGLAVLGDAGINAVVPAGFWDDVLQLMRGHFREGRTAEGLSDAVLRVGEKLSAHFPRRADDRDELPNTISSS